MGVKILRSKPTGHSVYVPLRLALDKRHWRLAPFETFAKISYARQLGLLLAGIKQETPWETVWKRGVMETDYKKEAIRQYLKYFRVWFIIIAVLAVVLAAAASIWNLRHRFSRTNMEAPEERVYDYADVLTDSEEERLRNQIAKMEQKLGMDIVIVTIDQSVEGSIAQEKYGYNTIRWEDNMRDLADDFWDNHKYGFNTSYLTDGIEGDGVLLLDNRYEGQKGEHLSTSGAAERRMSSRDIDNILWNTVDVYYDISPYKAYSAFVSELEIYLGDRGEAPLPWLGVIAGPVLVMLFYIAWGASKDKTKKTTTAYTYLAEGKPIINARRDEFIRKNVVTRHVPRSSGGSGGGGGGHSSGGGGHHHSSSGASHGGGSHRH